MPNWKNTRKWMPERLPSRMETIPAIDVTTGIIAKFLLYDGSKLRTRGGVDIFFSWIVYSSNFWYSEWIITTDKYTVLDHPIELETDRWKYTKFEIPRALQIEDLTSPMLRKSKLKNQKAIWINNFLLRNVKKRRLKIPKSL